MNKAFSIYLDLVRFLAACLVYVSHTNLRLLSTEIVPISSYGRSAVTVFFVLSGFVIAYITDTKETKWTVYAASRLSRVYSVALPAIVLTIIVDSIGRQLYPGLYYLPYDHFFIRSAASALLLNELWFVSILSFSNVPYWSICYEFWYYVAFGLIAFLPKRLAYFSLVAAALFVGPKILLLAPIWIAGVVLYRWQRLKTLTQGAAWFMTIASLIGIWAVHYVELNLVVASWLETILGKEWMTQLVWSRYFISDYVLGILVVCNFAGVRALSSTFESLLIQIEPPIRKLAAYTFTLYLLHQPLILFWAAVLRGNPDTTLYWWMTTSLVALSVFAIGYITENRRYLLKRSMESGLIRVEQSIAGKWHAFTR